MVGNTECKYLMRENYRKDHAKLVGNMECKYLLRENYRPDHISFQGQVKQGEIQLRKLGALPLAPYLGT